MVTVSQSLLSIHLMTFRIHLYFWHLLLLWSVLMDNLSVCQFYSIIPSKKSETAFSTNKSRIFKDLNFSTFTEELTRHLLLHTGDLSDITLRIEGSGADRVLVIYPYHLSSMIPHQLIHYI